MNPFDCIEVSFCGIDGDGEVVRTELLTNQERYMELKEKDL